MQPIARKALRARVTASLPRRMTPDAFVDIACRIENTGPVPLDSELPNPVHVAARWVSQHWVGDREPVRVPLPYPLPVGESVVLTVPVETPATPGTYRLRVAPVQEFVAWFDDVDPANGLQAEIALRPRRLKVLGPHELVERFPPPPVPWIAGYADRQRALVSAALQDRELMSRFRAGGRLPRGYGFGFDERVVEFPWLFVHELRGPILDAGSTLNHRHILDYLAERTCDLTILTLAPERDAFPERGVTYVYDDLRAAPFADGSFQTIVCLSTLEHVGMDNTRFGAHGVASDDPLIDRDRAVAELRRLLAPGGTILFTVPFGEPRDLGWLLPFDEEALARVRDQLEPAEWDVRIYAHSHEGWQPSAVAAAAGARFEDHAKNAHSVPDRAAAARAVACIRARL